MDSRLRGNDGGVKQSGCPFVLLLGHGDTLLAKEGECVKQSGCPFVFPPLFFLCFSFVF
jgi:hypothetical protein